MNDELPKEQLDQEVLEDLAELANENNLSEYFLYNEIKDVCNEISRNISLEIGNKILLDQLEILYQNGYYTTRLKQLVDDEITYENQRKESDLQNH